MSGHATPYFSGGNAFGHDGTGTNHGTWPNNDAFQNNNIAAQPRIIANYNFRLCSRRFINPPTRNSVIVVNEFAAGSNCQPLPTVIFFHMLNSQLRPMNTPSPIRIDGPGDQMPSNLKKMSGSKMQRLPICT